MVNSQARNPMKESSLSLLFSSRSARTLVSLSMAASLVAASIGSAMAAPPQPKQDPTPEDSARATELYENGKTLYDEGSYQGAALAFIQAYELSGDTNLLYNASLAYDRDGDFEHALEYLEYYRALAPEAERAKLGAKVESLKVRLAKADSEETTDGADGSDGSTETDGDGGTDSGGSGSTTPDGGPVDDDKPRIFTPLAGVFTGLAVAGLGTGLGLGLAAQASTRSAEENCDGVCLGAADDDLGKARGRALGADIAFGVGAAAAVAAIVVIAINASKRKKASTATLVPSHRGASLAVRF